MVKKLIIQLCIDHPGNYQLYIFGMPFLLLILRTLFLVYLLGICLVEKSFRKYLWCLLLIHFVFSIPQGLLLVYFGEKAVNNLFYIVYLFPSIPLLVMCILINKRKRFFSFLGSHKIAKQTLIGIVTGIFLFLLLRIINMLILGVQNNFNFSEIQSSGVLSLTLSPSHFLINSLGLIFVIPLFEEYFFRGMLFSGLERRKGILFAIIISSLIFGFYHLGIDSNISVINCFFIGLVLAFLRFRFNAIFSSVISHSIFNLFYVLSSILKLKEWGG